jgi:hypothetical protein
MIRPHGADDQSPNKTIITGLDPRSRHSEGAVRR